MFESKERDEYQLSNETFDLIGLKLDKELGRSSAVLVDLGAGTGYMTVRMAALTKGTVFACDTSKPMLDYIDKRAKAAKLINIRTVRVDEDSVELPDSAKADLILCVNTFHHIDERVEYLKELRMHNLRPEGLVALIDWKPGKLDIGPPESIKISPQDCVREFESAGFERVREKESDLLTNKSRYCYHLLFVCKPRDKATSQPRSFEEEFDV